MAIRELGEALPRNGGAFGRRRELRDLLVAAADAARRRRQDIGAQVDVEHAADSLRRRLALLLLAID